MHKNRRNKDNEDIKIILIVLIFLTIILTGFSKDLKNYYNTLYNNIFHFNNEVTINIDNEYTKELEKEISTLKDLLEIKSSEYNYISANVIYRNPSFWYKTLTIDKGINDGVKNGNVVINENGIVGVVKEVLNNTSTISLITNIDEKNKITVGIEYNDGIVYGLLKYYDYIKNELIIEDVTSDIYYTDDLKVYTTNFTNTFKSGILIGSVKEIIKKDLSNQIIVKPSVNYNNIKYVSVVGTM